MGLGFCLFVLENLQVHTTALQSVLDQGASFTETCLYIPSHPVSHEAYYEVYSVRGNYATLKFYFE